MPRLNFGEVFGRWAVVGDAIESRYKSGDIKRVYPCRCECGTLRNVVELSLRNGSSLSCGCLHKERVSQVHTKHGHATNDCNKRSPTYRTWQAMMARCGGEGKLGKQYYQDRGIVVCDRWLDFKNFLSDMGDRPRGCTIDRINNDAGYCKENCRWATKDQQSRNTSRSQYFTFNGETLCQKDWAKKLGIPETTLLYRLRRMSVDDAIGLVGYRPRS